MKKALMILALAAFMAPAGWAATACTGLVISIGSSAPASCMEGVFTFSNFRIVNNGGFGPGPLNISINAVNTSQGGHRVDFGFAVNHGVVAPTGADMILIYEVSAAGNIINGVNIERGTGTDYRIIENACSTAHAGSFGTSCQSSPLLADIFIASPEAPAFAVEFFEPTNFISISKDIQFRSGNSSLSDFVNSHHAVPEPGTMLLMGSALLGLAALRRRKQQ